LRNAPLRANLDAPGCRWKLVRNRADPGRASACAGSPRSWIGQRRQALQAARAAETRAKAALKAAQLNVEFAHVVAPITGRVSRHLVTPGNLIQGSESGATLLTSIVSLDPIYIYFDVDEATYRRNSRLWSEGLRASSRDTPNPVQVTLAGETRPSHEGKMDFLDNRLPDRHASRHHSPSTRLHPRSGRRR
jgi:multidrug efflux pump subunit AcrA (membrane-fusion protein)